MKVVSIVGARPQFIKLAPLARAFESFNRSASRTIEHVIVHTGQHYDPGMSDVFFEELKIPAPRVNLGIGSGPHGQQTGQMLESVEKVLLKERPDMVVVFGDTNSTMAGALAAAKLMIPLAHVEAGLRSFNRRMPEEINRVVTDHVSDLLLAPTTTAIENLRLEGLSQKALFTGDIMYDATLFNRDLAGEHSGLLEKLGLDKGAYGVVTLHRAENTDNPRSIAKILAALNEIAATLPLVFPMHPRTARHLSDHFTEWSPHRQLMLLDPVGYIDMLSLIGHARLLFTDSGGLQKEAFFLGCPTITLREETEWVETVQAGANILAGAEPANIRAAVAYLERRFSAGRPNFSTGVTSPFGDGHAAAKVCDAIVSFHHAR